MAVNIEIFCGLRNGEVLGLTWKDIDLKNKTINVNKARSYTKEKGMFTKTAKTDKSQRTINIPDVLVKQLLEYKVIQNGEKANCGNLWSNKWDVYPWLLTQWNGEGMFYSVLSSWLIKLLKRHNLKIINNESIAEEDKEKHLLPVIIFHKLRHTSATLLIGQNTDIRTVSARLGHAQTSTTMNIYVHGLNSSDIKTANALENLLDKSKKETLIERQAQ